MTLTKAHIAKTIHNHCSFTNARSTQLSDSLLETIKGTLGNGEDVLTTGFGRFCVKNKKRNAEEEAKQYPANIFADKC